MRTVSQLLLGSLLLVAGCFTLDLENGKLVCAEGDVCPSGYTCIQKTCWKNGTGPDTSDAGVPDLAVDGPTTTGDRENGQTCAAGSECKSGFCADGVCCETACTDACNACNLPTKAGKCSPLPANTPPSQGHDQCTVAAAETCGQNGMCDGAGKCQLHRDVVCKPASCDQATNKFSNESKCDGAGTCVTPPGITCEPFKCKSDGTACADSCTGPNDCVNAPCVGNSCGARANGIPCGSDGDCKSGHCVDHLCCDSSCGEQCNACDLPSTPGKCSPVTSGAPRGNRPACTGMTSGVCAGECKAGSSSCTYAPKTTTCRDQTCVGSTKTVGANCDGAGTCPDPVTVSCAPFVCTAANDCSSSCTDDSGCAGATPYCNSGLCKATKPLGRSCGGGAECTSGNCVDGVCCDQPQSACGGCKACNLAGSIGMCKAVATGMDVHSVCPASNSTCTAGGCNGAGACTPAANTVNCVSQSCSNGQITAATCNGTATGCPATTTSACPGHFACQDATSCKTSCSGNADCAAGYQCMGSACVPLSGLGQTCKMQSECAANLYCVDGYCCDTPAAQCDGCKACNVAGFLGQCRNVPANQDPHSVCAADTATCAAAGCNGSGACNVAASTVVCSSSCSGSTLTEQKCSGSTTGCPAATAVPCPGHVICANATSCKSPTCSADGDCVTGYYCNAGTCTPKAANGATCTIGTNCTQGSCNQCQSGFCVDGHCCGQSACSSCNACNIDNSGMCKPVPSGMPDPKGMCVNNPSNCQLSTCDGKGSCAFVAANTTCATTCANGGVTVGQVSSSTFTRYICNGTSAGCTTKDTSPTAPTCGNRICADNFSCRTNCRYDADCVRSSYCNSSGSCVPKGVFGAGCSADDQCLSGVCVSGACADCRTTIPPRVLSTGPSTTGTLPSPSEDCPPSAPICSGGHCVNGCTGNVCVYLPLSGPSGWVFGSCSLGQWNGGNAGYQDQCAGSVSTGSPYFGQTSVRYGACHAAGGTCICDSNMNSLYQCFSGRAPTCFGTSCGCGSAGMACPADQLCDAGVCKVAFGYACLVDTDCASGICTPATHTCAKSPLGKPCSVVTDCADYPPQSGFTTSCNSICRTESNSGD